MPTDAGRGPDTQFLPSEQGIHLDTGLRNMTGLTKAELMMYTKDPFWVRLRWGLFVLICVTWVGLLVGAVCAITSAPACKHNATKTWLQRNMSRYESGPLVQLESAAWLSEKSEWLEKVLQYSVRGVFMPVPVFEGTDDGFYGSGAAAHPRLTQFTKLANTSKQHNISLIVDLEMTTVNFVRKSHEWFVKSEACDESYKDYFVWVNGTAGTPPNNWTIKDSTEDEPAWSWSERRQAFYLHQQSADTADLNFSSPFVQDEFASLLLRWMDAGASGIRLLSVRQVFADDTSGPARSCREPPELNRVLEQWKRVVHNHTAGAVLSVGEPLPASNAAAAADTTCAWSAPEQLRVDLPPAYSNCSFKLESTSDCLVDVIKEQHDYWPALQLVHESDLVEVAWMLTILMPGTPVLSYEDLNPSENARKFVYDRLLEIREELHAPSITTRTELKKIDGAVVLHRWRGGAGYVVAVRVYVESVTVDLTKLSNNIPDTLTVTLTSSHLEKALPEVHINSTIPSNSLKMKGFSAIVLSYNKTK